MAYLLMLYFSEQNSRCLLQCELWYGPTGMACISEQLCYSFFILCRCLSVCRSGCICVWMHWRPGVYSKCISQSSVLLSAPRFFKKQVLTESFTLLIWQTSCLSSSRDSLVSDSTVLGLQVHDIMLLILHGLWSLNSDSHICTSRALVTETFPDLNSHYFRISKSMNMFYFLFYFLMNLGIESHTCWTSAVSMSVSSSLIQTISYWMLCVLTIHFNLLGSVTLKGRLHCSAK